MEGDEQNTTIVTVELAVDDQGEQTQSMAIFEQGLRERGIDEISYLARPDAQPSKAEPFTIAALVIAVAPVVVDQLLTFFREYATAYPERHMRIKIDNFELEIPADATPEEIERLIEAASKALRKVKTKR